MPIREGHRPGVQLIGPTIVPGRERTGDVRDRPGLQPRAAVTEGVDGVGDKRGLPGQSIVGAPTDPPLSLAGRNLAPGRRRPT